MAVIAVDTHSEWVADQIGGYSFKGFSISKSDTDELPVVVSKIYVGGAGNVSLVMADDSTPVVLTAVPAGTFLSGLRIRQITAANTTATNLIGFY